MVRAFPQRVDTSLPYRARIRAPDGGRVFGDGAVAGEEEQPLALYSLPLPFS